MVSPLAIQPAMTRLAEARRSVAITCAPLKRSTSPQITVLPSISALAPMRFNSGTCIKRFSKMVSVITPPPFAIMFSSVNCACMSVGKPGCGAVRTVTALSSRPVISKLIQSSPHSISAPASSSLAKTASNRCA
ncbi:Uncharacterised protein [Vibrio cholerae]|nr:Uncharacterised protein [Vibrio cholerae]CSD11173.1 Uncharacterised protein [Vibrio cholerae]